MPIVERANSLPEQDIQKQRDQIAGSIALEAIINDVGKVDVTLGDHTIPIFIQNDETGRSFPLTVSWHSPEDPKELKKLQELTGKLQGVDWSSINPRDYLYKWQRDLLNQVGRLPGGDVKQAYDLLEEGKRRMAEVQVWGLEVLRLTNPNIRVDSFLRATPNIPIELNLDEQDRTGLAVSTAAATTALTPKGSTALRVGTAGLAIVTAVVSCTPQEVPSGQIVVENGEVTVVPETQLVPVNKGPDGKTTSVPVVGVEGHQGVKTPEAQKKIVEEVTIGGLRGVVVEGSFGGGAGQSPEFAQAQAASPFEFVVTDENGIAIAGYNTTEEGKMVAFAKWDPENKVWNQYGTNTPFPIMQIAASGANIRTITEKGGKNIANEIEAGKIPEKQIVALTGKTVNASLKGENFVFNVVLKPDGIADLSKPPEQIAQALTANIASVALEEVKNAETVDSKIDADLTRVYQTTVYIDSDGNRTVKKEEVTFALEHVRTPELGLNIALATSEGVQEKIGGHIALGDIKNPGPEFRLEKAMLFGHMLHWARANNKMPVDRVAAEKLFYEEFLPALKQAQTKGQSLTYKLPYNGSTNIKDIGTVDILRTPIIITRQLFSESTNKPVNSWAVKSGATNVSLGMTVGVNPDGVLEIVYHETKTGIPSENDPEERDIRASSHISSIFTLFAEWDNVAVTLKLPRDLTQDAQSPQAPIANIITPGAYTGYKYEDPSTLHVVQK